MITLEPYCRLGPRYARQAPALAKAHIVVTDPSRQKSEIL
jgi:hypothetical protein